MTTPSVPLYMPSGLEHVFVYGTLRQGGSNDITRLQPPAVFIGNAEVTGRLYDLGTYPGMLLDPLGGPVKGEVYRITPGLEQVLDGIEELYPQRRDEYVKRRVEVWVAGSQLPCLVYEINPRYVEGLTEMRPADWMVRTTFCT